MDELDGRNFIKDFGGRSLKNAASKISPGLFAIPLYELEAIAKPATADKFIKQRFWEIALVQPLMLAKKHPVSSLHLEICTYTHLWTNVLNNPAKLAWILRLEFDQSVHFEYINRRILHQIEQYLEKPSRNKRGETTSSYFRNLLRFLEVMFKYSNPR